MDILEKLTEELESEGIFLIKERTTKSLVRTLEFSSIENGWECILMLVHGYAKSVSNNDNE